MTDSDVVIVGGGVVGHTLARGLIANTALSVTLVDAVDATKPDGKAVTGPGFDSRIIALSKRTAESLEQLGINISNAGATPIKHIQVTDKGYAGFCELDAADYRINAFGQVVSLARLGGELRDALKDDPRFRYVAPATVTRVVPAADEATVSFADGQTLSTKLVIMADGGRSPLTASLGYLREQQAYGQTAVIANIHTSQPHKLRAYERFTTHGPLALLPFDSEIDNHTMPGHGFSVVWTRLQAHAEKAVSGTDKQFIQGLQDTLGYRQGQIVRTTSRVSYPLGLSYTTAVAGQRSVIVGNAAQTLHPIAGQGFNLGMRDCLTLIQTVADHQDPGASAVTQAYSKARLTDRNVTMGLTDTLVHTFSNQHMPLVVARNAGLMALSALPSAKRQFVRQTTGFGRGSAVSIKEQS